MVHQQTSDYHLIITGRGLVRNGEKFYTESAHADLLNELAVKFGKVTYIGPIHKSSNADCRKDIKELNSDEIKVYQNDKFVDGSVFAKLKSVFIDAGIIQNLPGDKVLYIYFPGVYSFLIYPLIQSEFNAKVAYFGSDATDVAKSEPFDSPIGLMKKLSYPVLQRYVLSSLDLSFVRDPQLKRYGYGNSVEFANPVSSFSPSSTPKELSKDLSEPIQILNVAKCRKSKGHIYLLKSVQTLDDMGYDIELLLVGRGVKSLSESVQDMGIEDSVQLFGHINDTNKLEQMYRSSDIFVLSSLSEGFPRVLTEAMAMKLPIIATRVGGIPFVIEDAQEGLLVDPGSSEELVSGILEITEDSELRKRLASNGYISAKDRLKESAYSQQLAGIKRTINEEED